MHHITKYRSMYDLDSHTPTQATWEEIVRELSNHVRTGKKDSAPGFGPYLLRTPIAPCTRHKGPPRDHPHRCDDSVEHMSLCVFDVDIGTTTDIDECQRLLNEAGITHLFYSSFSFGSPGKEERPPFRLVIPLTTPVKPDAWQSFRLGVLRRFKVPADPSACSGLSHFYFLPSCPLDADPVVDYVPGKHLDPSTIPHTVALVPRDFAINLAADYEEPEEPTGPVNLEPIRRQLATKATRLQRFGNVREKQKGLWLRRCLDGEALDEHGNRNNAAMTVSGMLAWSLAGTPFSVLMSLIMPSVRKMQAEGSSVQDAEVARMIRGAMKDKAVQDEKDEAIQQAMREARERKLERYSTV